MFIQLTRENGDPVWINFDHIEGFQISAQGDPLLTEIWFPGENPVIRVKETAENINSKLMVFGKSL